MSRTPIVALAVALAAALAAAVVGVQIPPAAAQSAPPVTTPAASLAEARGYWDDLEFERVIEAARRAHAAPGADRETRVEALWLEGAAQVVLGEPDAATEVFWALFALDPDYELPADTSPRIAAVFRPARARWQVQVEAELATTLGEGYRAIEMDVRVPDTACGGLPVAVRVALRDPAGLVDRVVLSYRKRGAAHFSTLSAAARPGVIELAIPGAFTAAERPYQLECYVRARHRTGGALRRAGSADAPLAIAVAPGAVPGGASITGRWWFWTGAAALVVSAVAIPILVQRGQDAGPQRIVIEER